LKFNNPLIPGRLIKRYKRFLADIELENGEIVTAHCSNTGSMMQVSEPGSHVMLSGKSGALRKTKFEWEMIKVNSLWAGVNTSVPNILLKEGFEQKLIRQFRYYDRIITEKSYGQRSRADAVLYGKQPDLYVEAKNVSLVKNNTALFPDSATTRGQKHIEELINEIEKGNRAMLFLVSQRMDVDSAGIAGHIDPEFFKLTKYAVKKGLIVSAWKAYVSPGEIKLDKEIPFYL